MRQKRSLSSWDCQGVSSLVFDHSRIVSSVHSLVAKHYDYFYKSVSPYMMFPQSCGSPSLPGNLLSSIPRFFHSVEIASAKMLM